MRIVRDVRDYYNVVLPELHSPSFPIVGTTSLSSEGVLHAASVCSWGSVYSVATPTPLPCFLVLEGTTLHSITAPLGLPKKFGINYLRASLASLA